MQQQIQINQSPEQILNDASSFFAKRRARVTERTAQGLRFGLQGGAGDDGQVTVAPGAGGGSTVTVQAEGLGVWAIADGFIRELRKQARDQGRGGQRPPGASGAGTMRGDFSGLRERLGMQPDEAQPRPAQASAAPLETTAETTPPPAGGLGPGLSSAPPLETGESGGAALGVLPPHRALIHGDGGPAQAPQQAPDQPEQLKSTVPSAEDGGGVPQAHDVQVHSPATGAQGQSANPAESAGPAGSDRPEAPS